MRAHLLDDAHIMNALTNLLQASNNEENDHHFQSSII